MFSQTLNPRLQPLRLRSVKGANKALDLTYAYDARGKVTSTTDAATSGNNRSYSYDALGRLTSASGPWGTGSYVYDPLGNLRSKTLGARIVSNSYDSKNQLSSSTDTATGTRAMTYDTRGNIRKLGAQTLIYDRSDQPIILNGTISGNYRYDGNMKRVKSLLAGKTIYNVYDASGTLVHIDAVTDNKKTDYIDKIARISSGPGFNITTYLHNDHLGSAVSGTTSTGSINWTERYTPYGEKITDPTANRDQASFTGHIDDSATGLTYMQARYYDPVLGRFLSSDPVGFTPEMPFMFGRYTYVGGDPLNLTDPTGESPKEFFRGFGEGVTGTYKAFQLSQGIKQGDARSIWVARGISYGAQFSVANPGIARNFGARSVSQNKSRFLGRVVGGSTVSLAGGKGVGIGLKKLGAGKVTAAVAGISVSATNFSASQFGAAATALNGLYDNVQSAGFNPENLSIKTLGQAAIASATGGDVNFNSKTGVVSVQTSRLGSRIKRTTVIGKIKKDE